MSRISKLLAAVEAGANPLAGAIYHYRGYRMVEAGALGWMFSDPKAERKHPQHLSYTAASFDEAKNRIDEIRGLEA